MSSKKTKKELRKEAFKTGADPEKRKLFHQACKADSELKKKEKHKHDQKTAAFQEKSTTRIIRLSRNDFNFKIVLLFTVTKRKPRSRGGKSGWFLVGQKP